MAYWQSPHFHPHKNDPPGLAKEIKVEESEQCVAEDKFTDSKDISCEWYNSKKGIQKNKMEIFHDFCPPHPASLIEV